MIFDAEDFSIMLWRDLNTGGLSPEDYVETEAELFYDIFDSDDSSITLYKNGLFELNEQEWQHAIYDIESNGYASVVGIFAYCTETEAYVVTFLYDRDSDLDVIEYIMSTLTVTETGLNADVQTVYNSLVGEWLLDGEHQLVFYPGNTLDWFLVDQADYDNVLLALFFANSPVVNAAGEVERFTLTIMSIEMIEDGVSSSDNLRPMSYEATFVDADTLTLLSDEIGVYITMTRIS